MTESNSELYKNFCDYLNNPLLKKVYSYESFNIYAARLKSDRPEDKNKVLLVFVNKIFNDQSYNILSGIKWLSIQTKNLKNNKIFNRNDVIPFFSLVNKDFDGYLKHTLKIDRKTNKFIEYTHINNLQDNVTHKDSLKKDILSISIDDINLDLSNKYIKDTLDLFCTTITIINPLK